MGELDYIQKGSNKVNGQYTFVSHDAVTAKVHPLLVKYRIVVVPTVEEVKQDHNRTEVKLAVSFINGDDPKDSFTVRFPGYGIDSGDKGPGKAVSYAYKYALLKVFSLETGDDPDNDAASCYEPPKCLEFDALLHQMSEEAKTKLPKFLAYSSHALRKHVEEVKREAMNRPQDFLAALSNFQPRKGD